MKGGSEQYLRRALPAEDGKEPNIAGDGIDRTVRTVESPDGTESGIAGRDGEWNHRTGRTMRSTGIIGNGDENSES